MDRSELFNQALYVASRLIERGEREDALVVLQLLAEDEAFGSVRVIACVNCAIVHEQRNEVAQALAWYDRGMVHEEGGDTCIARRFKAALLANTGRIREALEIYLGLLAGPLKPEDEKAVRDALAAIEAAGG